MPTRLVLVTTILLTTLARRTTASGGGAPDRSADMVARPTGKGAGAPFLADEDVPTQDECLQDGFFCFEVTRGPKYTYRIRPDDERAVFRVFARRLLPSPPVPVSASSDDGSNSSTTVAPPTVATVAAAAKADGELSWSLSFDSSIMDARADLEFVPIESPDSPAPLRMTLIKQEDEKAVFKLFERRRATRSLASSSSSSVGTSSADWSLIAGERRREFFRDVVRDDHMVTFNGSSRLTSLLGLEERNNTIRFTMVIEVVAGESATESLELVTDDGGHFFLRENPEIRAQREVRRSMRPKLHASTHSSTIVIVVAVAGVFIIIAVIGVVHYLRKSGKADRGGSIVDVSRSP